MISTDIDKTEERAAAEHEKYLVPVASASRAPMRILGNMLIALGLFMLLGIGGWYGYTAWENQRFKDELVSKYGASAVDPAPAQITEATATVPPQPINLASGTGFGTNVSGSTVSTEVETSPPVGLSIPSVGIDSEVVPITWAMLPAPGGGVKNEWQVADYAVGHHFGSANPGEPGNVVLSGHVDYKGQVFKELHRVNKGDEVIVTTEKGQFLYVVTDLVLVLEEGASEEEKARNAAYMNPTPDQTITMITCWPYGIDTHRLIVIGKPYQSTLSTQSEFTIR